MLQLLVTEQLETHSRLSSKISHRAPAIHSKRHRLCLLHNSGQQHRKDQQHNNHVSNLILQKSRREKRT